MTRILLLLTTAAGLAMPTVVARIPTGAQPCAATAYGHFFYVDDYGSGVIARIDPRTNRVVQKAHVGNGPCGVVGGAGSLWVENFNDNTIARVDPGSLEVVKAIRVGVE